MSNPSRIGVVGMGTVGSGVVRVLQQSAGHIERQAGRPIVVEHATVSDISKPRSVKLPGNCLSSDFSAIADNPEISIAVMLIGGLEPARSMTIELLRKGKDVVTANKALLAEHGPELFAIAQENGRSVSFEAAIAGGIPIVAAIAECLAANRIESIRGILNGTSNFILTRMEEDGSDYADVLAVAQAEGYAEADPAMDVDGTDATQKLALLAHLAFGAWVPWATIPRVGLETVDQELLRFVDELGYRIRVVADASRTDNELAMRVGPTLVRKGTPLAETRGAFNAVSVVGDAVGPIFFHGLGAGQLPTASAVVADVIDTVVGRAAITFRTTGVLSDGSGCEMSGGGKSPYLLRLQVNDQPGVLAEITGVLGAEGISIASVIQHQNASESKAVPLVIMTHECESAAVERAVEAVDRQVSVQAPTTCLPVLDD